MTLEPRSGGTSAAVPPWRDVRVLNIAGQVAGVIVVGLVVAFMVRNFSSAMAERGLGFSFSGIILATILGIVVGVARLSPNWLVRRIASWYVELIRNTPLLVQLFILYFAVFLQLPAVSQTIALPGSIFLNQRGVFLPAPQTTETFPAWMLFVVAGVVALVAARVVAGRREEAGLPTHHLRALGWLALLALPVIGWAVVGGAPMGAEAPVPERVHLVGGP